jgi:hypothetical protein
MRYYIAGLSIALVIAGGIMIGFGITALSTPLTIGGVVAIFVSGMVGIFARSR